MCIDGNLRDNRPTGADCRMLHQFRCNERPRLVGDRRGSLYPLVTSTRAQEEVADASNVIPRPRL